MLMSETVLSKDWNTPEEDEAWAGLWKAMWSSFPLRVRFFWNAFIRKKTSRQDAKLAELAKEEYKIQITRNKKVSHNPPRLQKKS